MMKPVLIGVALTMAWSLPASAEDYSYIWPNDEHYDAYFGAVNAYMTHFNGGSYDRCGLDPIELDGDSIVERSGNDQLMAQCVDQIEEEECFNVGPRGEFCFTGVRRLIAVRVRLNRRGTRGRVWWNLYFEPDSSEGIEYKTTIQDPVRLRDGEWTHGDGMIFGHQFGPNASLHIRQSNEN